MSVTQLCKDPAHAALSHGQHTFLHETVAFCDVACGTYGWGAMPDLRGHDAHLLVVLL